MKLILAILLLTTTWSCATIFNGAKSKVTFDSNIDQADILTIDSDKYTDVEFPYVVKVKNGFKTSHVKAEAEGYEADDLEIRKVVHPTVFINLILGGIPGALVDVGTGAVMQTDGNNFYIEFSKSSNEDN